MIETRPSKLTLPPGSELHTAPKDSEYQDDTPIITRDTVIMGIYIQLPPRKTKQGIEYRGRIIKTEDADAGLQDMPVYYYKR